MSSENSENHENSAFKSNDIALETLNINSAAWGKFSTDGNALCIFSHDYVARVLLNTGSEDESAFKRWLDISGPVFDLAFRPSPLEVEFPTHEIAFCRFRRLFVERRDLELRFSPKSLDLINASKVVFDRSGQTILIGTSDGQVALYSLGDYPILRFASPLSFVHAEILALAISYDGKHIFATTKAGEYFICDWKNEEYYPLLRDPLSHSASTNWKSFLLSTHPNRPLVAFVYPRSSTMVIDTENKNTFFCETEDGSDILALFFTPQGSLAIVSEGSVEIFSAPRSDDSAGSKLTRLAQVRANPGRRIVSASVNGKIINMATLPKAQPQRLLSIALPVMQAFGVFSTPSPQGVPVK